MHSNYSKIIIDLGTGDGRFVFKNALSNPDNLYIGIDPSEKQLQTYLKKINRNKLINAQLLVGSLENLPQEVIGKADELNILLPWGTLLQSVIKPTKESVEKITSLLNKTKDVPLKIIILLGYHLEAEPSEITRLNLPELTEKYILEAVIPEFKQHGCKLSKLKQLSKDQLDTIETTWGKKLRFGKDRPLFLIELEYL